MKVNSVRLLLAAIAFIIVVTAIYFALIPHHFFHPHNQVKKTAFASSMTVSPPNTTEKISGEEEESRSFIITTNVETSLELAKTIHREHGLVLFTMINDAFFEFAASWCCNTAAFPGIHQRALFLATDLPTGQRLRSLFPDVSVVALPGARFRGSQEYSQAGYVRMMVERTRFVDRLLGAGVRVLLFEVDCVWLSDPLPLVLSQQSERDITATRVTGKETTAGGFLLLNPTPAAVQFWHKLTAMMESLFVRLKALPATAAVSEGLNDQEFFTSLARRRYAGVRIVYLPSDAFLDGKWYRLSPRQRENSRHRRWPVIINNNWLLGNDAKRRRAKAFGHWFWDEAQGKCDSSVVNRLRH